MLQKSPVWSEITPVKYKKYSYWLSIEQAIYVKQ